MQFSWTEPPPPSSLSTTTSFPSEEVPLLRSPLHINLHKQNEEATRLQYWRDLGAVEEQRREETRAGGSRNCFSHYSNFCVLQSESGGNLVSTFTFCRSLIKVKFPTDQFRPALGSCCCSVDCHHAQKTSKLPYFRLFRPIPKYFLPLLPYTDLVPPSTDPVPPSTNQYRRILTQYHHGSTITALY